MAVESASEWDRGTGEGARLIIRTDLNERIKESGIREDAIDKDYVIGWALRGIGSDPRLKTSWAFKSGL